MGTNVQQSAKDLNPADINQGINDGFAGRTSALTREQMEQVVMAYQQQQVQAMTQGNLAKGKAFLAENGKKANIKNHSIGLTIRSVKRR